MSWLDPEAWAAAHPTPARAADDELRAAIADEPRRVIALVGPPGVASAAALALARGWGGAVWYGPGDVGALDALVRDSAAPLVILDGVAARAVLDDLAAHRLHPRLRVVVPCDPSTAPELPEVAVLPRGSIAVAVVDAAELAPPTPGPPPIAATLEAGDPLDARVAEARLRRDKPALAAALTELETRAEEPARRVRAGLALASMTREVARADAAVAEARALADPSLLADALAGLADLRQHTGDPPGAIAAYGEAIAIHDAAGAIGRAALLRSFVATMHGEAADFDAACDAIARAIEDRRAIGDVMGAALALGRLARWQVELGRDDLARLATEEACAIATAIADPRGVGYAQWFLGALAERRGDGEAAMACYRASLEAYAELGDVPDRVVESLATLQRAYDGTPAPRPEPAPAPDRLVTLRRKP